MRYRNISSFIILCLLSLTIHGQGVGGNREYPITYTKLKGFGVEYHVAVQVFGPNPATSVFRLLQEGEPPAPEVTYDLRLWIWESSEWQWWFKDVDVNVATQFEWVLCETPFVEAIWYQLGGPGKDMWLLYPYSKLGNGLDMKMIAISSDLNTNIHLDGCKDEGWGGENVNPTEGREFSQR